MSGSEPPEPDVDVEDEDEDEPISTSSAGTICMIVMPDSIPFATQRNEKRQMRITMVLAKGVYWIFN